MIRNGKSRPTFYLYSSPSANPRKFSLRQLANPFRVVSVRRTFNVRNCAKLGPRVVTLRISHARRKWGEQSTGRALKRAKRDPTYAVLRSLFTVCQTEILDNNQSIGYKCHWVIIGQITDTWISYSHGYYWSLIAESCSIFTVQLRCDNYFFLLIRVYLLLCKMYEKYFKNRSCVFQFLTNYVYFLRILSDITFITANNTSSLLIADFNCYMLII